ncbi:MAG: type II secretion system protein [bacterium]|nr:type II secretion system protein [bacterium]MDZ4205727.1 type II secretion system protein [Patescibacteria group bacterium]
MSSFFKRRGFSLVEMLIYISILVLMLAVIMNIVVSVVRSGRIINALRNVENSATVSLERLVREVRQAESVDIGLSFLDSSPGKLVLVGTDSSGNPRTVEFYLSSGRLLFKENGADIGALTQADAWVSSLVFRRFFGPNSEGIKTEMTIESGTSTHYRSEKFYSSAILR